MSRANPSRRPRTSEAQSSGSWSDVSDSETPAARADLPRRKVKSFVNNTVIVDHDSHQDYELGERLTKSLELVENGGSHNDAHSLPINDWDIMPSSTPSSLPLTGFYMVEAPDFVSLNSGQRQSEAEQDQAEKIKNKLMSAWNNMRHGWTVKVKTNFRFDREIWLLGKLYHNTAQEREEHKKRMECGMTVVTAMEKFKRDFTSRFWFTYRQDFPYLPGTQLTCDTGWGCMLRSGQMLLCQALSTHFLGRDWRWYPPQRRQEVLYHQQLIRYFGDLPSDECPFSIHKLVQYGVKMCKKPGDWYGPASVAHVLKEAMDQAPNYNPILGQLCLYVAQDCTVYKHDVIDLCTQPRHRGNQGSQSGSERSWNHEPTWRPVILLIPVRLGGESFNTYYIPSLQHLLRDELCIGIMGGKPKHSVYFVGWQEDKLIYLDPHFCQDFVDVLKKDFDTHSFHCMSPRKMHFSKMDPSCTLGFYCQTKTDFESVERMVMDAHKLAAAQGEKGVYPMFVFTEGRSCDLTYQGPSRERYLRVQRVDRQGRIKHPSKDTDDFVFL